MAVNVGDGQRDELMILLEEVAQANRQLNVENRALQEEMRKRDDENKKTLKSLEEKLDGTIRSTDKSPNSNSVPRRKRTKRIHVPAQCRVSILYSLSLRFEQYILKCVLYSFLNTKSSQCSAI